MTTSAKSNLQVFGKMYFWLTWSKVFQHVNYDWFLCRCNFAVFFLFFLLFRVKLKLIFCHHLILALCFLFFFVKNIFFLFVFCLLTTFTLNPLLYTVIVIFKCFSLSWAVCHVIYFPLYLVFYFFPFLFFERLFDPLASGFLSLASQLSLLMLGLIWLRPLTVSTVRLWALWPTLKLVDFPVVGVSTSNQNMPSGVLLSPAWSIYLIQITNIKTCNSHSHMHHSRNTQCTVWQLMLDAFSDANQALWHLCPDTVRIPYSFWLSTTSILPWMYDARWVSVPLH